MKYFNLILTLFLASACSIGKDLDNMNGKMNEISTISDSMKKTNAELDESNAETKAMGDQMTALVDILNNLAGGIVRAPAGENECCTDISGRSVQDLTALRDEIKSSMSYKILSHQIIPKTLDLIKSVKICTPDQSTDSTKASLITEIQSLVLQL